MPEQAKPKMATEIPASITTPDIVETRLGTLRFFDGLPDEATVQTVVYDPQTRSMLQTDQRFPSLSSQTEDISINPDSSVDIYFGPTPPAGKEHNWVQTIPGKG